MQGARRGSPVPAGGLHQVFEVGSHARMASEGISTFHTRSQRNGLGVCQGAKKDAYAPRATGCARKKAKTPRVQKRYSTSRQADEMMVRKATEDPSRMHQWPKVHYPTYVKYKIKSPRSHFYFAGFLCITYCLCAYYCWCWLLRIWFGKTSPAGHQ